MDDYIYARLSSPTNSHDPVIAGQARTLWPLVNLYSVQHLVSQVQAGRGTWPENDDHIYARLNSAAHSHDPVIAGQARTLWPLVSLYSVQHLGITSAGRERDLA